MRKQTTPRTLPGIIKQALVDMQPLMDELAETMSPHQRHAPLFLKLFTWYGTVQRDCAPFLRGIRLPRAVPSGHSITRSRHRPIPPPLDQGA